MRVQVGRDVVEDGDDNRRSGLQCKSRNKANHLLIHEVIAFLDPGREVGVTEQLLYRHCECAVEGGE